MDGVPAFSEAEEALKKKKRKKFDAYGNEILETSDQIEIVREVDFELALGVLTNVQGLYLQAEHVPPEFDLTPLAPT